MEKKGKRLTRNEVVPFRQDELHHCFGTGFSSCAVFKWASSAPIDSNHVHSGLTSGMSTTQGTAVFLDQIMIQWGIVCCTRANEERRDKYNAIEDPEMVNQDVGLTE
ncbi:hypothetical protein EDD15DRAFT_143403 [Pisolithus albus]|nr:hypothetical protein EDD15DRAFT_143403 [Pisolithus albus]